MFGNDSNFPSVQVMQYIFYLVTPCLSGPCQNGATCKDKRRTFKCLCPPGYEGKKCHIKSKLDEWFLFHFKYTTRDT